jgi:hypothetical protein
MKMEARVIIFQNPAINKVSYLRVYRTYYICIGDLGRMRDSCILKC